MVYTASPRLMAGVLTITVLAFGCPDPTRAGTPDDQVAATAAYQRGDFATALRLIRPLAEQGDPLAEVDLAGLYSDGRGVAKDPAAAANWYRKAADRDFAPAEYFLAQSLGPVAPIPQGGTEASRLLHRAAEQGFAPAQFQLGMFSVLTPFLQALGARPQTSADAEAGQWLRKAADAGYAPAQAFLGLQHSMHIGLPEEQAEALRWFHLAADQGDMTAEEGLGALYAREHGVPPDYAESARWYLKSAEHGDATAQRRLANIYVTGLGVPKDVVRGRMWFEVSQRKFSGKNDARQRTLMLDLFNLEAPTMAAADIAEAKRLAAEWSARHPAKPEFAVETWIAPASLSAGTSAGTAASSPAAASAKACTHEEQVQARLAKQNGYTGGPKCD